MRRAQPNRSPNQPRLVYVVTHPMSAHTLLRGQLAAMQAYGFEVTLMCSPGAELEVVRNREGITVWPIEIPRGMHPRRDGQALVELYRAFRVLQPEIVNAGTTKAGLLGMLAARLARVPVRVYVLRGLRLETVTGPRRAVLHAAERLASACSTRILAVSASLAENYTSQRFAPEDKVTVLGSGSSNGIDPGRFEPFDKRVEAARTLRVRLGIPSEAPVIGFVGRLVRDKGISELIGAFQRVRARIPQARLLLVGDFEAGDPVQPEVVRRIETDPGVVRTGFVEDVVPYYFAMDVLAFPSHREGFPNVPLEAAAAAVPTVGARSTGTVDAVQDGATGALVPIGDVDELAAVLIRYLERPDLRLRHGAAARERALRVFRSEPYWTLLRDEYLHRLREAGLFSDYQRR